MPPALRGADVVILGETHDNPHHHRIQAEIISGLDPAAVVFEMLSPQQAQTLAGLEDRSEAAMGAALEWATSGWPDFSMYHPVLTASDAPIFGAALPSGDVRRAVGEGAAAVFGPEAARFGLDQPLPGDEQALREDMQARAHCNALPASLMPGMVEAQRLRDAAFARTTLQAYHIHGAPVVVIAGRGHARSDWGIPAALAHAAPEVTVASLALLEQGDPGQETLFATQITTEPAQREDPCTAFD